MYWFVWVDFFDTENSRASFFFIMVDSMAGPHQYGCGVIPGGVHGGGKPSAVSASSLLWAVLLESGEGAWFSEGSDPHSRFWLHGGS